MRLKFVDGFTEYAFTYHKEELEAILLELDDSQHFSITIDCLHLNECSAELAEAVVNEPQQMLPYFDEALIAAQRVVLAEGTDSYMMTLKTNCHARITSLPTNPETTKENVSSLRSEDCGRFVALQGTVIRSGQVKMLEWEREYLCSKCKDVITQQCDLEMGNVLEPPPRCRNDQCPGTNFHPTESPPVCIDYQELKIQEQVQKLTMGFMPRTIPVILTNDLVDACKAGDDIIVHGTVLRRWSNLKHDGVRCDVSMFVYASHISVSQQDKATQIITEETRTAFEAYWQKHAPNPMVGRNLLLAAVCPELYGMYPVKLCLMLSLIGGVARTERSGMKIRGESHLLLVGDAGTGKSECLRFGAKVASRSVLTNGVGSTSAGLTVTAMRDPSGEWMLEAGALVLADGGVCCVDEFESMNENDRTTIHEAMEQQTVSVAKAGLICKLQTRTTVVAAINPKGKYDPDQDLSVNVALASPLLSRFDLVLILHDQQDSSWDKVISDHILNTVPSTDASTQAPSCFTAPSTASSSPADSDFWTVDLIRDYIQHLRTSISPELSSEAMDVLSRYYQAQRSSDGRNAARTTIRLLESLVRIAQAHARLMYRPRVMLEDAVTALLCVESSKHTSTLVGVQPVLQAEFPEEPDSAYFELEDMVLHRLGLDNLLEYSFRSRPPDPWRCGRSMAPSQVSSAGTDHHPLSSSPMPQPTSRASTQTDNVSQPADTHTSNISQHAETHTDSNGDGDGPSPGNRGTSTKHTTRSHTLSQADQPRSSSQAHHTRSQDRQQTARLSNSQETARQRSTQHTDHTHRSTQSNTQAPVPRHGPGKMDANPAPSSRTQSQSQGTQPAKRARVQNTNTARTSDDTEEDVLGMQGSTAEGGHVESQAGIDQHEPIEGHGGNDDASGANDDPFAIMDVEVSQADLPPRQRPAFLASDSESDSSDGNFV